MKSMEIYAKIENIPLLTSFADELMEAAECPMKAQMQIDIAIDEIVSNIAYYAYPTKEGKIKLDFKIDQEKARVILQFHDQGIPYNPLEHKEPDTSLQADERTPGGLGILIVKRSMDQVMYEYKDNSNILTLIKNF